MNRFVKRSSGPLRTHTPEMISPSSKGFEFKTPMSYKPNHTPSPSRQDKLMKELGLDDIPFDDDDDDDDLDEELNSDNETEADQNTRKEHFSDIEFQALQAELERKERQREELLLQLKARADKITAFKTQLQRAEQAKRGQLKILKKRYDMQLQEKENLVNNLQEFIEEQENSIIELECKISGEERQAKPQAGKAIEKLVQTINNLQHEKGDLTQKLLGSQLKIEILERELKDVEERHKKELASLEEKAENIDKEYEEFRKGVVSPRREKEKDREKIYNEVNAKYCELEAEYLKLQDSYHALEQDWQHDVEERDARIENLEEERRSLERKCKDIESKCATLAATPPKVQVKEIVPDSMKKEIEKLKADYIQLQYSSGEQQKDSISKISDLKLEINRLQSATERLDLEKMRLQNEFEKTQNDSARNISLEKETAENATKKCGDLERKLHQSSKELAKLKEEQQETVETLRSQMKEQVAKAVWETEQKYSHFKSAFSAMQHLLNQSVSAIRHLKKEQRQAKREVTELRKAFGPAMKEATKALVKQVEDVNERSKLLTERYRKEMALRKKFHNELVELKGNIRVFCRVRPNISEDGSGPMAANVVTFDSEDDGLLYVNNKGPEKQFEFDKVFSPDSTQVQVFDDVSALVTSCIDGYNVCIFAYGQTGSGKTFTMEGSTSNPGINQRALQLLFEETSSRGDWTYSIQVSVLEIYNETLRDLLGDNPTTKLDIKQGKDGLFVPGQRMIEVSSVEEVNKVFFLGRKNRATAATDMNEHSSRSHAILIITIQGENVTTGTRTSGKLNLVDLAGSERVSKSGAEGARMKEAQSINKSLSALGDVIHSLKNKTQHIPYRNTKLTYLLQDSLGGDSKTLMVVQVAPVLKNVGETLCSLNFAQRVRQVELGQATRKVETNSEESNLRPRTPKRK